MCAIIFRDSELGYLHSQSHNVPVDFASHATAA